MFGSPKKSQRQVVIDWSLKFKPLGMEGLNARYRWQENLIELTVQRDDMQTFNARVERLFVNPDVLYISEYFRRIEHNTKITKEMILFVTKRLDDSQRKHA